MLVAVALGVSTVALSADWRGFRGGTLAGIGTGNPPTSWSVKDGTNVTWRAAVPGGGHSGPIVSGNRVYVTTAVPLDGRAPSLVLGDVQRSGIDSAGDNGRHEWRLIALDRATGKQVWSTVAHTGVPRVKRHVKASHASATPATNGSVVVALMGSEGLYSFDAATGALRWKQDVGVMDVGLVDDPTYQWGPASSPVIVDDLILVQNDQHTGSFLAAYELGTGKEVWRTPRQEMPSWATPLVARSGDRGIVITNSPNRVRAHDLRTGKELWSFADGTQVKVPSPVLAGNNVVVTGGYAPGTRPTWAIPLNATGTVTADRLAWSLDRGSSYTSTPLVYDGLLYMTTDAGIISAYDAATGERIYQQRLAAGAGISASPVAAAGRLYFASEDGDVIVVRAGREFEVLATNSMGEVVMATPALDGDAILVRTTGHIVAVGK
jgi:outer membrane protein assembly factor BamB